MRRDDERVESMEHKKSDQQWILLIHQLPPTPTNLRVRIWRKLQKFGAVAVKNSVYVLPFNEKTHEDFQWLKQEIESAGGEATVFRAGALEGTTDREIIGLFRKTRDEEYAQITQELDGLMGAIRERKRGGHLPTGRAGHYEAELEKLGKLHKELARIVGTDFFEASLRTASEAVYERCHKALQIELRRSKPSTQPKVGKGAAARDGHYLRRRWVTRRNLFIDRLAAIWLIKRFVDPKARFFFVAEDETLDGAVAFDMYGGEFTHRGPDCTFETMIKEFGLTDDTGLRAIAEIVHDLDLKDGKFNRLEAAGLGVVIRGLADSLKDDRRLMRQCEPLFDGLYELFKRNDAAKIPRKRRGSSVTHGRSARKKLPGV